MLETIVNRLDLLFIEKSCTEATLIRLDERLSVQALQLRRCRGTKAENPRNECTEKICAFYIAFGYVNITDPQPEQTTPPQGSWGAITSQ